MTSSGTKRARKLKFIIVALLISACGPYVFPKFGVRLEQVVIYLLVLLMMFGYFFAVRPNKLNRDLMAIVGLFGFVIIWTSLPTFLGDHPRASAEKVISAIERFARPLATILIVALAARSVERTELKHSLRLACLLICLLLALNSALCVAEVYLDTWPLVQYFVRPQENVEESQWLWQVCVDAGRYSGIFVQPIENGVAHSIGLMAWIYYASSVRRMSSALWALLVMVIIGGLMSVSKAFLLGGLPLGMAYMLMSPLARRVMHWKAALPTVAGVVVVEELLQTWHGSSRFLELLGVGNSQFDLLQLYSGGRYRQGEGVTDCFADIWETAPISGLGFGYAYGWPLDNAWLEFFAQGGVMALGLYTLILFMLARPALYGLQERKEEGVLLTTLWVIIVGCGLGAPMLTLNRTSTILWVMVSVCIIIIRQRSGMTGDDNLRWPHGKRRSHFAAGQQRT